MKPEPLTLEERESHTALLLLHLKGVLAAAGALELELPPSLFAVPFYREHGGKLPTSFPAASADVSFNETVRVTIMDAAFELGATWAHYHRTRKTPPG